MLLKLTNMLPCSMIFHTQLQFAHQCRLYNPCMREFVASMYVFEGKIELRKKPTVPEK